MRIGRQAVPIGRGSHDSPEWPTSAAMKLKYTEAAEFELFDERVEEIQKKQEEVRRENGGEERVQNPIASEARQ